MYLMYTVYTCTRKPMTNCACVQGILMFNGCWFYNKCLTILHTVLTVVVPLKHEHQQDLQPFLQENEVSSKAAEELAFPQAFHADSLVFLVDYPATSIWTGCQGLAMKCWSLHGSLIVCTLSMQLQCITAWRQQGCLQGLLCHTSDRQKFLSCSSAVVEWSRMFAQAVPMPAITWPFSCLFLKGTAGVPPCKALQTNQFYGTLLAFQQ